CEVQYSNQGTYADTNSPVLSDEELDSLAKEVFVVDDCIWQGRESNKLLPELRRRDYSIKLLSAVGDRYNARELRETVIFGYAPEDGFARIIRD
ncbi:MAG TPA: hypothetical protein VK338_04220, partial [Candidatus Nitrosocosmicus sp.]|nr:hypothetical protein [Candidatus Nitrosocosmicus sp.]